MKASNKFNRIALAVALSVGVSTAAFAQETSSGITGKITGPQGNPAAGTTVIVRHEPTGSVKRVTVNASGQFKAKGLRVGGPYTVTIDSDKFQDVVVNELYLGLGEDTKLNRQLAEEQIENIVVTGSAMALVENNASSSIFNSEAITSAPSLDRDIKDVVRNNPLVNLSPGEDRAMSIAGSNPRTNSITVDGIPLNDDFGLNDGGYPTQRSPFPIAALDQVSVQVAPTHAKEGGFTGGNVNAVFKSGTNEFHGDVFYELKNDSLAGTPNYNGEDINLDFEEENYGFTLGGPIMEDKLFFFVAYEKYDSPQQIEYGPKGSGLGSNETNATVADVEAIQAIANSVYGVSDIGTYTSQPQLGDEKYMIKLDWNINDYHRADFVYMYNDGNRTNNMTSSATELRLDTHWYNKAEELNNYSLKLYSDWTDDFSTEMSVTLKSVDTEQRSLKSDLGLGDITVENVDVDGDGTTADIAFGSDQYRHSNYLNNDLTIVKLDGTYLFDEHTLDFGIDYQILEVENQFLPCSRGTVVFDSLEDFQNRIASSYSYENGKGNDPSAVLAKFERTNLSLYVNDTFEMTDDLELSFGLRYERFSTDDEPTLNQSLLDRTGFVNTYTLDGADILLPRFGFKYFVSDDVTVRGSIGRFTGGNPNVWISNSYSNDGISKQSFSSRDVTVPTNILTTPPQEAIDRVQNGTGFSVSNFIDPDFELPSQWTYMLNSEVMFDVEGLADGFLWSTTAIYTDREDTAEWINAALLQDGDVVGSTSDGSLPFYDTRELDIMLTNADDTGRSIVFSTSLSNNFDNGFGFDFSYTNQDITDGNPGGSSTARSNYRYGHFGDHQKTQVGTSTYETEHKLSLNLRYSEEFFSGYETTFNLYLSRQSGQPYSHVFRTTNLQGGRFFNQDLIQPSGFFTTFGGNYLVYVPTANDPNVIYNGITEAEVLAAFDELGLSGYAGGTVAKNAARTPWTTTADLYISQEVPGFMDGHKGEVYFVIQNLANLIDSSAGKVYTKNFNTQQVINMDINEETGQYIFGGLRDDGLAFEAVDSTYKIKIGVSYKF